MNLKASISHLTIEKSDHPNKMPFTGVLLYLDSASQQAPHGSDGHRIYVPSEVAARRLNTLVGMPLNYSAGGLDGHDSENAVGVITKPWIDGNKVMVKGYIWKKTFPDAHEDLHGKALGMSMELAEVDIADKEEDIWHLNDFYFTGATALWPDSAAYTKTALAAAAAVRGAQKGETMKKKTVPTGSGSANKAAVSTAKILAAAITTAVTAQVAKTLEASQAPLMTAIGDLTKAVSTLKASAAPSPEEVAASELENALLASGETATEEEQDIDASSDDDEDEDIDASGEEVAAESEEEEEGDDEEEEGDEEMEGAGGTDDMSDINKGQTENKGSKTTTTGPAGGPSTDMRMSNNNIKAMKAAAAKIKSLHAQHLKTVKRTKVLEGRIRTLESRNEAMEAQIEAAASRTNRRTVTPELRNLLEKNGVDIQAAQAGRKLSVAFVDKMFRDIGFNLDPEQRMAFKNMMLSSGIMENPTQGTN